jgi:S1-C subfamily serine protease
MKTVCISALLLLHIAVVNASQPPARPWLGMALTMRTSPTGARFVYVAQVGPGTPAAKAGVQAGDVITRFGGKAVDFRDQLAIIEFVSRLKIGAKVELGLTRAGSQLRKVLVVERLPVEYEQAWKETFDRATQERASAGH